MYGCISDGYTGCMDAHYAFGLSDSFYYNAYSIVLRFPVTHNGSPTLIRAIKFNFTRTTGLHPRPHPLPATLYPLLAN